MLERISEQISGTFSTRITSTAERAVLNLESITSYYRGLFRGARYNFNYKIESLAVVYNLPSLAEKPNPGRPPARTNEQRIADDVEFGRTYNERATDENDKFFASRLSLWLYSHQNTQGSLIGKVLLYNNLTELNMPLMQYLMSSILNEDSEIRAQVTHLNPRIDNLAIVGSYLGNVNYDFETGPQPLTFP